MKKKVLLVSTPYMGIYHDIINGLENLGLDVEFISQKAFPNNPNAVLHKKVTKKRKEDFQNTLKDYWKEQLDHRDKKDLYFDYLLVINGLTIHPYLFETLRNINKHIIAANYIYDRIKGVYQIDHNFKYFDRIFSFDPSDVREYNLNLLPIFWVPVNEKPTDSLDVFAFGGNDPIRVDVFKRIKGIVDKFHLHGIVKVYHTEVKSKIKYTVRRLGKLLLQGRKSPSLKDLSSDLFTTESIPTDVFRKYIVSSKVIIDTNHPYQEGLTARFMWALGAGRKIVTNNHHVAEYDFYTKEQVLILNDSTTDDNILSFINTKSVIPQDTRMSIDKCRIDNWLKTILGIGE